MIHTDSFMTAKAVFKVWSSEPDSVRFIDLRSRTDFDRSRLPNSEALTTSQAAERIRLSSVEILFVIVSPGGHEIPELSVLSNVVFIEGGFESWSLCGFPTQIAEEG